MRSPRAALGLLRDTFRSSSPRSLTRARMLNRLTHDPILTSRWPRHPAYRPALSRPTASCGGKLCSHVSHNTSADLGGGLYNYQLHDGLFPEGMRDHFRASTLLAEHALQQVGRPDHAAMPYRQPQMRNAGLEVVLEARPARGSHGPSFFMNSSLGQSGQRRRAGLVRRPLRRARTRANAPPAPSAPRLRILCARQRWRRAGGEDLLDRGNEPRARRR